MHEMVCGRGDGQISDLRVGVALQAIPDESVTRSVVAIFEFEVDLDSMQVGKQ